MQVLLKWQIKSRFPCNTAATEQSKVNNVLLLRQNATLPTAYGQACNKLIITVPSLYKVAREMSTRETRLAKICSGTQYTHVLQALSDQAVPGRVESPSQVRFHTILSCLSYLTLRGYVDVGKVMWRERERGEKIEGGKRVAGRMVKQGNITGTL